MSGVCSRLCCSYLSTNCVGMEVVTRTSAIVFECGLEDQYDSYTAIISQVMHEEQRARGMSAECIVLLPVTVTVEK